MTQGIREFTNAKFAELLPQLGTLGGTGFRKAVMGAVQERFSISVASAATHYNHSLKMARLETPKAVEGLGRPEDKKGGRPVLHGVTVIKVKTGEEVATGISKGAAETMIARAEKMRKAKLAIKVEEVAPAATEPVSAEAAPAEVPAADPVA